MRVAKHIFIAAVVAVVVSPSAGFNRAQRCPQASERWVLCGAKRRKVDNEEAKAGLSKLPPDVDLKKLPKSVQRVINKDQYDPMRDRFVKVEGSELVWGEDRWDRDAITAYWREATGLASINPRWDSLLSQKANRKDRVNMSPGALPEAVTEPDGWCKARHQFRINNKGPPYELAALDAKGGGEGAATVAVNAAQPMKVEAAASNVGKETAAMEVHETIAREKMATASAATTNKQKKGKRRNGWSAFNEKRKKRDMQRRANEQKQRRENDERLEAYAQLYLSDSEKLEDASASVPADTCVDQGADTGEGTGAGSSDELDLSVVAAMLQRTDEAASSEPAPSMTVLESLNDEDICLLSADYDSCMVEGEGERKLQELAESGLRKGKIKWWSKTGNYGFISQRKDKDVFVHNSALLKRSVALGKGAPVEFDLEPEEKGGRPRASLVIVSDPSWKKRQQRSGGTKGKRRDGRVSKPAKATNMATAAEAAKVEDAVANEVKREADETEAAMPGSESTVTAAVESPAVVTEPISPAVPKAGRGGSEAPLAASSPPEEPASELKNENTLKPGFGMPAFSWALDPFRRKK